MPRAESPFHNTPTTTDRIGQIWIGPLALAIVFVAAVPGRWPGLVWRGPLARRTARIGAGNSAREDCAYYQLTG